MQRYIGGASIRQIAREERRDRATVTKIVRSSEMNAVVQKIRERYYGLGFDALDAVQHTLRIQKDGRLGRQLLVDIGVAPSPAEVYAISSQLVAIDDSEMTPFEVAMTEDEEGQMKRIAYGCACALEASAEAFGTPLQTPDEIRHDRKVVAAAEEITGGRFLEICDEGGTEEKRIRQLAEQKVKREETRLLLPPRRSQRALPLREQAAIVRQLTNRN
jgi:hypothetical protein